MLQVFFKYFFVFTVLLSVWLKRDQARPAGYKHFDIWKRGYIIASGIRPAGIQAEHIRRFCEGHIPPDRGQLHDREGQKHRYRS